MGLSLKKLGKNIWETLTPQNEEAIRRADASRVAGLQKLQQNPGKYGVLADPGRRQQYIKQSRPQTFSIPKAARSSLKEAVTRPDVWNASPVDIGNFKGSGIVEGVINSPFKVSQGIARTGAGDVGGGLGQITTGLIEGPAGLIPISRVAQAGKGASLLPKVAAGAKAGLKEGVVTGGLYGGGSAASEGARPLDVAKSAAMSAAIGGAAGSVLGGASPIIEAGAKQIVKAASPSPVYADFEPDIKPKVKAKNGVEKTVQQIMEQDGISREAATVKMDAMLRRDLAPDLTLPNRAPVKQVVKPKKDAQVKELLQELSKAQNTSRVEESLVAAKVAAKARKLGVKTNQEFIDRYQAGALTTPAEKALGKFIREEVTDPNFAVQQALDPSIKYRKNYVPQSYKEGAEAAEEAARVLQQSTGAAQPRAFNTYKEAAEFGLTPEYKRLDQMLAVNAGSATRAKANRQVINKGLESGIFSTSPRGGSPVTGFFDGDGAQIYASKKVADIFNGITQKDSSGLAKTLRGTAKASQIMQDIALQGGIPGTNANFFVAGQGIKDTTRNIGKAVLHPVQAVKQEGHLVADFFRGNRGTQKRFTKNADFVRQMADRGLYITPQSSVMGRGKNVVERTWDTLGNNPTFGRYMPNRLLSTSQEIYKQSVKKLGHEGALDLAARQTKAYMGVVDQILKGRTNLTADGIATAFFAPKYRESIINALTNTAKSVTTQIGNKDYQASRQLLLGMAITLAGYEELNRKINGHSMFENREGQELSVQIPYGEKDAKGNQPVVNIPFMPGFMTIPRAIGGAVSSAANKNPKGVVAEGSKVLSMPLNTAGALLGNRDYFGRPIYIDEATANKEGVEADDTATAAKKVGLYAAGQLSPAWARGAINQAQGKPVEQNIATALEAPVRFGKLPNPETVAYFENRDNFYKTLNKNDRALFDKINPIKKNIKGETIKDKRNQLTSPSNYGDLLANQEFADKYQAYKKNEPNHDPLWDLNKDQLRSYMQAQVISKNNPGGDSKTVSALYKRLPADFFTKREQYFSSLESSGVDLGGSDYTPKPQMPNNLVAFSENYHKLPYGTGQRSAALRSPEGQAYIAYLNQNRIYNNQERADLGLPPLEDPSQQYDSYYARSGRRRASGKNKSTGSAYKYAVSPSAGGKSAKPTVSVKKSGGVRSVAAKTAKPKVTLKKSLA